MVNPVVDSMVDKILATNKKTFRGLKLPGANFAGRDLKNADFRSASLPGANFTGCDLTYANFEGANCYHCDFTDARLYRTNFKDAQLAQCIMRPSDLFGCTVTLECKTFEGMEVEPGWWYGWLFYGLLMKPPTQEAKDALIQFLGVERYTLLRKQYARREM